VKTEEEVRALWHFPYVDPRLNVGIEQHC